MMQDAAEIFLSSNLEESFQGKTRYNDNNNLTQQMLSNKLLSSFKIPNNQFEDKFTTALKKPLVHFNVLKARQDFLLKSKDVFNMISNYRSSSDSDPKLCRRQQSLTVMHRQQKISDVDINQAVFDSLILNALKGPKTRFNVPPIDIEDIMDIAPKATAMGPLNISTFDPTLRNQLLTAKKTDFLPLQKQLVKFSLDLVEQGDFPIVYPARPAEKAEVIKITRENRMVFVSSSISTRIASHFMGPFEKCLTGSIEMGSPLGIAMEDDYGQRIADWLYPEYGYNPFMISGDKKGNEAHETSDGALAYMGVIFRFYKNWTDEHKRLFSGNLTEYIKPHLMVGEILLTPPRTGVVPSGSMHTRIGNCFRNFYETLVTISHSFGKGLIDKEISDSLYISFLKSIEGGDDKLIPLSNKLNSKQRSVILEAFRNSSIQRNQPYGELTIMPLIAENINAAGEIEGGVEFQKHYFVRDPMTHRVFYTRDSKRVFSKLLHFKSDVTPEIFLSNIIKCMEQVPGNIVTFKRLNMLRRIVIDIIVENEYEITDDCLREYINRSMKNGGDLDLNICFNEVLLLNIGATKKHNISKLSEAIFRKFGVSINALNSGRKFIPDDKERRQQDIKNARLIMKAEDLLKTNDFDNRQSECLIQNSTIYQGSISKHALEVKCGKQRGKQFCVRKSDYNFDNEKAQTRRNDLIEVMLESYPFDKVLNYKIDWNLDDCLSMLIHGRNLRSGSLTKDLSSRKAEFPNSTWDTTHAKFYFACKYAKLPKNGIVFHPGCGTIVSRSVYGIIEALNPSLILACDPNAYNIEMTIGETRVKYMKSTWKDCYCLLKSYIGEKNFTVVSDVSFSHPDDSNQIDPASTNKVNSDMFHKFKTGVYKAVITGKKIFKPVYKHAPHNLEYFTCYDECDNNAMERICYLISQGNKVRNDYYMLGTNERGVKGKIFLNEFELKDIDVLIPSNATHPKRMSLSYQTPKRSSMRNYQEDDAAYYTILDSFRKKIFKTDEKPSKPPEGRIFYSCRDEMGFRASILCSFLEYELLHPGTINFRKWNDPFVKKTF